MKILCACALAIAACSASVDDTTSSSSTSAATTGAGGGGGSGGAGGGVCDDSGPDPRNHTAGTCENLGETSLVAYCHTAIDELKPGVAYAAITCLANVCLEGPGCTIEEYRSQAEQCLIDALANACADDSANTICMELDMLCAGADCHALVDGMSNATRAETLACAQADCSQGLLACVQQALTP